MSRPQISIDEIAKLLFNFYGLQVISARELNGYDDRNFHVIVDVNINNNKRIGKVVKCGYVLKIVNSLDSEKELLFEAQTELLRHLNNNHVKCPLPVLTVDGKGHMKIDLRSGGHIARLLEYIEGTILYEIESDSKILFQIGQLTARIDSVLQSFRHPAYDDYKTPWTLGEVPNLTNYLHAVRDKNKRILFEEIISEFTRRVAAKSHTLQKGLIHGDVNEQNLLVDKNGGRWTVTALIDYGDTHHACYLFELAIAMSYMIFQSGKIDNGAYVLAGYKSVRDVPDQEFNLLKICISARLVQSIVMGAYANLQDPNNTYVLTTATRGWEMVKELSEIDETHLLEKWKHISLTYNADECKIAD
ncbi:hydroxylysine kinase [Cylas formicarius]|uniref:hydroxylysine kinase n=1 Tax=Cylas formicarius TaxID=197179 RepID=UPI002958C01A|nr:hydroxylysine kinase [Cylas formicarius]